MKLYSILALACNWTLAFGLANGNPHRGDRDWHTIYVKSGQSIQHALDRSYPGSTIVVEPGVYTEQLTISKSGISLVGRHGAVLAPPGSATSNTCSGLAGPGSQAGICITGAGVKLSDFVTEHRQVLSVKRRVVDVSVEGLSVRGFGLNIAVVGAENTRVISNKLDNGTLYGFLTDGSINTLVKDNTINFAPDLGFIGLCNDNKAGAEIVHNTVSGYRVALCVQTNGAQIKDNHVFNNCIGAFVDPRVHDAVLNNNHVGPTNPACGPTGVGILLSGSVNVKVTNNLIEGQKAGGAGAGIVLVDDPCTEVALSCLANPTTAVAHRNVVERNVLKNNDFDIFVQTTSTDNVVEDNRCTTSLPASACS